MIGYTILNKRKWSKGPNPTKRLGGQKMIYSKKDIRSFYTNQIMKYLQDGYEINIESMNGSQGEDSKIDLIKDEEVIRIILDRRYEMYVGTMFYIRIIRFEYDGSTIYWNDRGQFIKTFNFLNAKDGKNTMV